MYFHIDPPGTDYTKVQLDVPNGQLEDVIRAITTTGRASDDAPAERIHVEVDLTGRLGVLHIPSAKAFNEYVAEVGRVLSDDLAVRGHLNDGGRGNEGVHLDGRGGDHQSSAQATGGPLHEGFGHGDVDRHSLGNRGRVEAGQDGGAVGREGHVHGGSSCGCRCAGAARACGPGDTEATEPPLTKEEPWLWAAQELTAMLSALLETGPEAYEDTEGVELGGPDCGDGAEGLEGGDA